MSLPIVILPIASGTTPPINAGDVGVTIQVPADIVQSLTSATCTAVIIAPSGIRSTAAATVSSDGTNATFQTTATTFPVSGTYQIQLEASFSAGAQVATTSIFSLTVGKEL